MAMIKKLLSKEEKVRRFDAAQAKRKEYMDYRRVELSIYREKAKAQGITVSREEVLARMAK